MCVQNMKLSLLKLSSLDLLDDAAPKCRQEPGTMKCIERSVTPEQMENQQDPKCYGTPVRKAKGEFGSQISLGVEIWPQEVVTADACSWGAAEANTSTTTGLRQT